MERRRPWISKRIWLVALASLAGLRPVEAGEPPESRSWKPGQARAITVERGLARVRVPHDDASEHILVVSCLASRDKPWPIRLRVEADRTEAPDATSPIVDDIHPLPLRPAPEPRRSVTPLPHPPQVRAFHVLVGPGDPIDAEQYRHVRGLLGAVGPRVQIYVDADDRSQVDEQTLRDLMTTFEYQVAPTSERYWGTAADVDGDERFTILLTSWLDRMGGGHQRADGLFRGADMIRTLGSPLSNGSDMIYLNARLRSGPHLRTVLAHEYAHAVLFSRKSLRDNDSRVGMEEEGWLDEAIAHLVEDVHGFSRSNLDHRVAAFLESPDRYPLVVPDYYRANLFRSDGHRGSTYLFLRWCVDRFGPGLLGALVESEHRGTANLEHTTGVPFAELYRHWSVALLVDSRRPGFRSSARPTPALHHDGEEMTWEHAGTTSRYVRVPAFDAPRTRIEVEAPPEAELQATVVRLPAAGRNSN